MLFAAAEYGRADIIASAAKSLQEKLDGAATAEDLSTALGEARSEDGLEPHSNRAMLQAAWHRRSLLDVACSSEKVDAVRYL